MTQEQKTVGKGGLIIALAAIASVTLLGWLGVVSSDAVVAVIGGVIGSTGTTVGGRLGGS